MNIPSLFILGIIYAGLNVLAFVAFASDKLKAKTNRWRTPENALLLLAMLGPVGALAAMTGLRHKTRHVKFFLVPVFLILHLLLFFWLWPQVAG
jgi:uncharacterized membrane protein YsdA (DUF1294 family)